MASTLSTEQVLADYANTSEWARRNNRGMTGLRRAGRPVAVEHEPLRLQALEILLRDGYENVTMSQIAQETGVSVRTLHRHFPAKSDIVWQGAHGGAEALRTELALIGAEFTPLEAIAVAVGRVVELDEEEEPLARLKMRALTAMPEKLAPDPGVYLGWRAVTADFLAHRFCLAEDDLRVQALAASVQAAIATALAWWSTRTDDQHPEQSVRIALEALSHLSEPTILSCPGLVGGSARLVPSV